MPCISKWQTISIPIWSLPKNVLETWGEMFCGLLRPKYFGIVTKHYALADTARQPEINPTEKFVYQWFPSNLTEPLICQEKWAKITGSRCAKLIRHVLETKIKSTKN